MKTILFSFFVLGFSLFTCYAQQQQQDSLYQHPAGMITAQVVSCYPPQNYTHAPLGDSLTITFGQSTPINPASLTDSTFVVQAQQSGWHQGTASYNQQTNTITFKPTKPFFVGELVTAVATRKITYDSAGTFVPIHGFAWQFYGEVTKQTRATFRDTEHVQAEQNHNVILTSLTDMDNDSNLDIMYATNRVDLKSSILFNSGDGINYQKIMFGIPGGAYPADYNLRGEQDAIIGDDSGFVANNNNNRIFTYGNKQNFKGYFNAEIVDIDFDGHPEYIGEGFDSQGYKDTLNTYSVLGDSIIRRQAIYLNGDMTYLSVGDFNNDGAIDVYGALSSFTGGDITNVILYNDGTGKLLPPASNTFQ